MALGAAGASAGRPATVNVTASAARERPSVIGVPRAEIGAPGSLLPVLLAKSSPTPTHARTSGTDDDIPGVAIPASPFTGSLSRTTDLDDVFSIALTAGQTLIASLSGPAGSDFRLYLYAPGTASVKNPDTPWAAVALGSYPCSFSYAVTQSGTYYLDVYAEIGEGAYTVTYSGASPPPSGGTAPVVLSMTAGSKTVPYRGFVTLVGALTDASSGALLPNRAVEWLYSQDDNIQRKWIDGGPASSTTGEYSLSLGPVERRTYFVLYFAGDAQYAEALSNFVKVMALAKLTPPEIPSQVRSRTLYTSWGTLKPPHTAAQNKASHTRVYWERYSGGRWQPVISMFASSYRNTATATEYSVRMQYVPGKWRMRAVHQDSDHAKTISPWRTFSAY